MEPTAQPKAATPSDEVLLDRIAQARDGAAFEQLAQRYMPLAYNLALNFSGNACLAEEAVQDALVEVWLHAGHFDAQRGRARSWILTIAANKAKTLRTREGREKKRIMTKHATTQAQAAADDAPTAESGEINKALRQMLERLTQFERQIVSLYYGANLSQDEIRRILEIPQTTISARLRDTLAKLRRDLCAEGFAAALPLLEAGKLADVLLGGKTMPASLKAQVMRAVASTANRSARAAAASGGLGVWLWDLVAAVLLIAGDAAWWLASAPAPRRESAKSPAAPVEEAGPKAQAEADTAVPPAKLLGAWNFDRPTDTDGFQVLHGGWKWMPGAGIGGSGCMRTTGEEFSARIEIPLERLPVFLILHSKIYLESQDMSVEALRHEIFFDMAVWQMARWRAVFRNVGKTVSINPNKPRWVESRLYIAEDHVDGFNGGHRTNLIAGEREPGSALCLLIGGTQDLDDISLLEIDPGEMPDASAPMQALRAIPPEKRTGTVDLPELRSSYPGMKVNVIFGGPEDWNFTDQYRTGSDAKK